MNYEETFRKMRVMRMLGMHEAFKLSLETKQHQQLASDELIHLLIDAEYEDRQNRKIHRYLKAARFRYQSSMEEVDFSSPRGLDKNQLLRLASCQFLEKQENIIITGPTGVGKSYLASALGHQGCMKGYKVLYYNSAKLFTQLKMSRADGSYVKLINRLEKQDLLILDDFGLHPLDEENRLMLLEVIEDRHGRRSTMVTSQLPVIKWYELFQAQTIADAVLDRIVHTAHRIELKGESLRKKKSGITK
jgi:DNA replication protein DnaC